MNTSTNLIKNYAGTGSAGYSGDSGLAASAKIQSAQYLSFDNSGNLFITDGGYNSVIRKVITSTGVISTYAGSYYNGWAFSGDGDVAKSASLHYPAVTAFDKNNNLYIA